MNLKDQLNRERRSLARMQQHHEAKLPGWKQRQSDIQNNSTFGKAGEQVRQQVQEQFETWKGIHEQAVESVKQRIADLEKQLEEQASAVIKKARAELDTVKQEKLEQWLLDGGTKESFLNVWPDMEAELLRQRVMSQDDQADQRAAIAQKRSQFAI